jgi:UDPglucose 6-dehydrogenase
MRFDVLMTETSKTREPVVIVGFGWVGQANALALVQMGYTVSYFDPSPPKHHYSAYAPLYEKVKRLEKVSDLDGENTWYIVCVGDRVSEDGLQDISFIRNALGSLKGLKGGVILRSTILPETLKTLSFDYYVPEFLHERKAVEECLDPFFFVVGKHKGVRNSPSFFATWREKAVKTFNGTPEEASHVKYLSNLWNSVRIAFTNEFGDSVGEPNSKEALHSINRVLDFVFGGRQYMRYGRAFGGHCLPKDTRAYARALRDAGKNSNLLDGAYRSNKMHEETQDKYPDLPEWFSEWVPPRRSGKEALKTLGQAVIRNIRNPWLIIARFSGR